MLEEPTSLSYIIEVVAECLEKDYGIDPAPLYETLGVSRESLASATERLPNSAFLKMYDRAATVVRRPGAGREGRTPYSAKTPGRDRTCLDVEREPG